MRRIPPLLIPLLLSGCFTAPPEPLKPLPQPPLSQSTQIHTSQEQPLPPAWWTLFQDPELDQLVTRVREANRDLVQAAARLEAAQARARLAGADLAPQITGAANVKQMRTSGNTVTSFGPREQILMGLNLQFTYEVDLWGRIRATRAAAVQGIVFSAADHAAAEILLCSEVAKHHLTRHGLRREVEILDRQIAADADTEQLQSTRSEAGFATALDIERVRIEKATREVERSTLLEREQAVANAIDLLCGQPAGGLTATNLPPSTTFTPTVPEPLPLALLESRPDVAARRAKWEAAFQRVQAARAAFYPALRLTGTIGTESEKPEDLLDWQSRLWSLVAGLTGPIFDGGRLSATLELERATLRETAAAYEAAVLTAYREVADALNTLHWLTERQQATERVRDAARRAVTLSQERYDKGFATYLEVIESRRSGLVAERTLVQLHVARQLATIDLIRALGPH